MKTLLTMEIPKVGDRLMRIISNYSREYDTPLMPRPCVVTYVNENHSWYQVEFLDTHIRECYGLPVLDHGAIDFSMVRPSPSNGAVDVICIETAKAYPSITDCAENTGVTKAYIREPPT